MNHVSIDRRGLFRAGAAAAVGLALGSQTRATAEQAKRTRALRLAHLTDTHIQPERGADQGVVACLRHVQALTDPPELIITGGDSIMDSFESDQTRTKLQWDLWHKVLAGECSLPIWSVIGNHDVWGWNRKSSGTTGTEAGYGKQWAVDALHLSRPYERKERGGWQFLLLDSTHVGHEPGTYIARLDDEQFAWLAGELASIGGKQPVCVVSHMPILTVTAFDGGGQGPWSVSDSLMHSDSLRIRELFQKHANVRLCLSGHLHQVDRVDFRGVSYLCNGAVSGAWWKGDNVGFDEGYAVLDLYDDGTFEREYVAYGWTPRR